MLKGNEIKMRKLWILSIIMHDSGLCGNKGTVDCHADKNAQTWKTDSSGSCISPGHFTPQAHAARFKTRNIPQVGILT